MENTFQDQAPLYPIMFASYTSLFVKERTYMSNTWQNLIPWGGVILVNYIFYSPYHLTLEDQGSSFT